MVAMVERMEKREWIVLENQGQKIFGVLHLPIKQYDKIPIVVCLHGFASSKHGTNRSYVTLAENFTREGIATLRFDFRGSGDSEGSLSEITLTDLVSDALCVYQSLNQLDGIDPSRMGIFGSSLGGSIAMLSLKEHLKAKAMVLWAPVASGELWYRDFIMQQPELAKRDPKEVLGKYRGIPLHPTFREQFGQMCAAQALEGLSHIPLLHLQGENDTTTSMDHQKLFQRYCVKHTAEKRFVTFPNTEHHLGNSTILPEVVQESVYWYKKHL